MGRGQGIRVMLGEIDVGSVGSWGSLGNRFKCMHGVWGGSMWGTDGSNHGFKGIQENRWGVGIMRVYRVQPG